MVTGQRLLGTSQGTRRKAPPALGGKATLVLQYKHQNRRWTQKQKITIHLTDEVSTAKSLALLHSLQTSGTKNTLHIKQLQRMFKKKTIALYGQRW